MDIRSGVVPMGAYLVAFILMLVLDGLWLAAMRRVYAGAVQAVQQQRPMVVRIAPAAVAYAAMFLGMAALVLPALAPRQGEARPTFLRVLRVAGLYGFTVYAVFNATVMAIFEAYPWRVALVDTVWGTVLYTAVAWAATRVT